MTSDLSDNPWVFFGGRMAGGKLQHLPNPAVMINTMTNKVGANGKRARIPFGNGYYQMLSLPVGNGLPLVERIRQKRDAGDTRSTDEIVANEMRKNLEKSRSIPVAPVANKKNVVKDVSDYLVPNFLQPSIDSIEKAKAAGEDLKPHLGKIGEFYQDALIVSDPKKVDFFATDCMSCHMVDSVLRDMERAVRIQAPGELARLVEASPFKPAPGYPERPSAEGLKTSNYQVVNFGYFHDRPSVGLRAVNETIHALEIIKSSFSTDFTRQADTCSQKLLDACVAQVSPPFLLRIPAAALVRYGAEVDTQCRAKVCPSAPVIKYQDSEKPIIGRLAKGAVLKAQPKALEELKDSQKCDVPGQEISSYFVEKTLVNGHYKLWTNFKCKNIDRSQTMYVLKEQIAF